jgi:2-oxoglutarate ferredoxin oxidoreductase subunit delta
MEKKAVKGRITINKELCKGCYLCISVCPRETIVITDKLNQQGYYATEYRDNTENGKECIACSRCATICPDVAIEVYRES